MSKNVYPEKIQIGQHIPAFIRIFTGRNLDSQGGKVSSYQTSF